MEAGQQVYTMFQYKISIVEMKLGVFCKNVPLGMKYFILRGIFSGTP